MMFHRMAFPHLLETREKIFGSDFTYLCERLLGCFGIFPVFENFLVSVNGLAEDVFFYSR